ncbi:hypothetical protein NPIL_456711 [Nephila pilipes]|uniref:Uncharacterized protein n=1 Tax=Nephila pilipes TaxID=299642 RepID=A0A8X6UNZ9_NEPPI|nr:hypothetical protein NPIL_456711 [Nephila pilipes]
MPHHREPSLTVICGHARQAVPGRRVHKAISLKRQSPGQFLPSPPETEQWTSNSTIRLDSTLEQTEIVF